VRIALLGSGSTGNALLVSAGSTRVLVDAGFNPTDAANRLAALGVDLFPRGVDAIVITHHHGDHIAHAEQLARATGAPVYLHAGIEAKRLRAKFETRAYDTCGAVRIGDIVFSAFAVPHDAPQVALRFEAGSARFVLATDLGHVPRGLVEFVGDADVALVEANYCPELLAYGPYPPKLKSRVGGPLGHLANEQTAELAAALVGRRLGRLLLGHISRTNNSPARALAAVTRAAAGLAVDAIPHGVPRAFAVEPTRAGAQLALPFA
jgi:phosphoribosyl 1,2-cyclic phosphodiesterase